MPTLAGHQRGQLGVDIAGNDAACGYIDSHREETRTLIRRVQLFLCVCVCACVEPGTPKHLFQRFIGSKTDTMKRQQPSLCHRFFVFK